MGAREYAAGRGSSCPTILWGWLGVMEIFVVTSETAQEMAMILRRDTAVNPTWQEKPGSYTSATGRLKLQFVPGSALPLTRRKRGFTLNQ